MTNESKLDEISRLLSQLLEIQLYSAEQLKSINQELLDEADEGRTIVSNGTLSTTAFTIIDTQISPGHPVKGFTIENTDAAGNNIYVGMNIVVQPQVDADPIDVIKTDPIFNQVVPNESVEFKYNRNKIKSVHLLAVTGTPSYKLWMTW